MEILWAPIASDEVINCQSLAKIITMGTKMGYASSMEGGGLSPASRGWGRRGQMKEGTDEGEDGQVQSRVRVYVHTPQPLSNL